MIETLLLSKLCILQNKHSLMRKYTEQTNTDMQWCVRYYFQYLIPKLSSITFSQVWLGEWSMLGFVLLFHHLILIISDLQCPMMLCLFLNSHILVMRWISELWQVLLSLLLLFRTHAFKMLSLAVFL